MTLHRPFPHRGRLGTEDIEADTPKQALALARSFLVTCDEALPFQGYDFDIPINEIEISGPEGRGLPSGRTRFQAQLAARDLLIG